ncbi:MAG: MOSC domain-containing protein [Candidatus Zixiibacteriota bacterium]|nr:MAG: MOSC domain-containing protein [candidate division Zixibacteria bacterium]
MYGRVHRLSVSPEKGLKKTNVDEAVMVEGFGIAGDAHAGSERQVSLLPFEAFDSVREQLPEIAPGDFAENITTQGLDLSSASVGDMLSIGAQVRLVITQIGKECHNGCYIREAVGDCIMPRLGLFARIARGGVIRVGDTIAWERPTEKIGEVRHDRVTESM